MPRQISETTQKDLDWKKLRDKLLKVIKSKKDWSRFKRYVDSEFDYKLKN